MKQMKPIFNLAVLFILTAFIMSCSEDDSSFPKTAVLRVVHIINDIDAINVTTGGNTLKLVGASSEVSFRSYEIFSMRQDIATDVVVVPETDTLNVLYKESLSLKGINSLYLYGDNGEAEALLLEDQVKQFTDSLVAIRFINLSKTSGPIDIAIAGEATGTVSGLDYQDVTDYIEYPAKEADGSYTFTFKDALGNNLRGLTNGFKVDPLEEDNESVKKNITLAITDYILPVGNNLLGKRVTRINDY